MDQYNRLLDVFNNGVSNNLAKNRMNQTVEAVQEALMQTTSHHFKDRKESTLIRNSFANEFSAKPIAVNFSQNNTQQMIRSNSIYIISSHCSRNFLAYIFYT